MYTAVVSVGVMLLASEPISKFVNNRPAFKMLALSLLLLIVVSLIAEGLEFHIPKGYIYFSMAFALLVNIFYRRLLIKFYMSMNYPATHVYGTGKCRQCAA